MKRIVFSLLALFFVHGLMAQWTTGTGGIYYNSGTVSIGQGSVGGSKLNIATSSANDGIWITNNGSSYGGSSGFVSITGPSLGQGGWNGITLAGDAGIAYG